MRTAMLAGLLATHPALAVAAEVVPPRRRELDPDASPVILRDLRQEWRDLAERYGRDAMTHATSPDDVDTLAAHLNRERSRAMLANTERNPGALAAAEAKRERRRLRDLGRTG